MKDLSPEQIREVSDWWQERLGLQGWQIEYQRARGYEMEGNLGSIYWSMPKRRATCRLIVSRDLGPGDKDNDEEVVIVHELLHIVTGAWHDKTNDLLNDFERDICIEQPLEMLSEFLVKMRHEHAIGHFSWEKEELGKSIRDSVVIKEAD